MLEQRRQRTLQSPRYEIAGHEEPRVNPASSLEGAQQDAQALRLTLVAEGSDQQGLLADAQRLAETARFFGRRQIGRLEQVRDLDDGCLRCMFVNQSRGGRIVDDDRAGGCRNAR